MTGHGKMRILAKSESFGKKRFCGELLFFQIGIEDHRQVADKNAAEPSGANFAAPEENEAILPEWFEALQLFRKVFVEVDAEFARNLVLDHHRVAEQPANDRAPQTVLVRKLIAAHRREASLRHCPLPRWDVSMILCVGILNPANRGYAHPVKIGARFGGIALKITVQRAILLRDSKLVARL